jgi:hypothetical protein
MVGRIESRKIRQTGCKPTETTMKTKVIALASALAATLTLATGADAGGGVRLGFGFPLGSFKATPAHGGGTATSYGTSKAKKKTPTQVHHAARNPDKPTPRVAKADTAKPGKPVTEKAEKSDETVETAAPVTGSSALIQQSLPRAPAAGEKTETDAAAAPANDAAVAASTGTPADASGNCKKFVPAIGMTVSVGCGE